PDIKPQPSYLFDNSSTSCQTGGVHIKDDRQHAARQDARALDGLVLDGREEPLGFAPAVFGVGGKLIDVRHGAGQSRISKASCAKVVPVEMPVIGGQVEARMENQG
ncbi:hypothetical protein, partial [Ralstonia pseudosolanacearum]|uniref:hypothetical protein n=1 Tax=Ralstonia pseudosolanacearum TaxID=1310165 RepID=UPI003CF2D8C1